MRNLAVFLLCFLFTACATEQGYRDYLNVYLEAPEEFLIDSWGAPDDTYNVGNVKYLSYGKNNVVYTPANYNTTFYGNSSNTFGYNSTPVYFSCKTTFKIENGEVVSYNFEGNNCTMR